MPSTEVGGDVRKRFELLTMGTVVDPIARCRNPLSGRDRCGVPNHGHDLAMTAHLGAQNAKPFSALW